MTFSLPCLIHALPSVGLQCVLAVFPGYFKKEKNNRFVNSEWTAALVNKGLRYIITSKILDLDSVVGRIRKCLCLHESFITISINNYSKNYQVKSTKSDKTKTRVNETY